MPDFNGADEQQEGAGGPILGVIPISIENPRCAMPGAPTIFILSEWTVRKAPPTTLATGRKSRRIAFRGDSKRRAGTRE